MKDPKPVPPKGPAAEQAYHAIRDSIDTGWDVERAAEAARWLEAQLGHEVPGMVMKAGSFPPAALAS